MAKATITRAEATITLELTEHEAEVMFAIYSNDVAGSPPTMSVYEELLSLGIQKAPKFTPISGISSQLPRYE